MSSVIIKAAFAVLGSAALTKIAMPSIMDAFKLNNKKKETVPSEDITEEDLDDEQ